MYNEVLCMFRDEIGEGSHTVWEVDCFEFRHFELSKVFVRDCFGGFIHVQIERKTLHLHVCSALCGSFAMRLEASFLTRQLGTLEAVAGDYSIRLAVGSSLKTTALSSFGVVCRTGSSTARERRCRGTGC